MAAWLLFWWLSPVRPAACAASPEIAQLERQMVELVNTARSDPAYRAETGGAAAPLVWNEALATVARCHSEDMARRGYFAHVEPGGGDLAARLAQAGIRWQACAENIASADTVAQAKRLFLNEPPGQANHRGNLLNRGFTEIGVGIARGADDQLLITQDFIRPDAAGGGRR